jgi:hypothetical protein
MKKYQSKLEEEIEVL